MIAVEKLSNGLTLLVEEIPHELLIPGGIVMDDDAKVGASLILMELCTRGAGEYNSRALSQAFEEKGIRHGEGAEMERYSLRGALLAENLGRALELISLIVQQPSLPEAEIENIRSVLLQDILSLKDNPSQRAMVELAKRYYPMPYGRPSLGTEEGLRATDIGQLRNLWQEEFRPEGAVLSVAGKISTAQVREIAERCFGGWKGRAKERVPFGEITPHQSYHIQEESAQVQIVMAYPSAPFADSTYYDAKLVAGILSGGMFGRLFIEVREKRGLCYSVNARHSSSDKYGTVSVYAGTTTERAQETMDVIVTELRRLSGTISEEELARAKANLGAALVIGEESTSSRASSNASDWWICGRIRSLDEIQAGIERVSLDSIETYLTKYPANIFTTLTLGGRELQTVKYFN